MSDEAFLQRLEEAVHLYITAMGYNPAITAGRLQAWATQQKQPHFQAVAAILHPQDIAVEDALFDSSCPLIGICYCHSGEPTQWWYQQVRAGMARTGWKIPVVNRIMSSYAELAELHVLPGHQGHGLGRRMLEIMLQGRTENVVMLSTPEVPQESNRAWRLYRSLGFVDVLRHFYFDGDSRPFAVLGLQLPPGLAREVDHDQDRDQDAADVNTAATDQVSRQEPK